MNLLKKTINKTCADNFIGANVNDCNKFVKAVALAEDITIEASLNADGITGLIRTNPQWIQLTDEFNGPALVKRKEEKAKEYADNGFLVIAAIKSKEISSNAEHGHLAIILSGDLVWSPTNKNSFPKGSWGSINTGGGKHNESIAFSFGSSYINKVTYSAYFTPLLSKR